MYTKILTLVLKTGSFRSRSISSSDGPTVLAAVLMRSSRFRRSNAMYGPMKGSNTQESIPTIAGRAPSTSSLTPSPLALRVASTDCAPRPTAAPSRPLPPAEFAQCRFISSALLASLRSPSAVSTCVDRRLPSSFASNREWASFSNAKHLWTA